MGREGKGHHHEDTQDTKQNLGKLSICMLPFVSLW
jgi:hypothetical protein